MEIDTLASTAVRAAGAPARVQELVGTFQRIRGGKPASAAERAALTAGMRALPKLHAAHTLSEEHQFILASLRELASLTGRLEGYGSFQDLGTDLEVLRGIAHHLVDAESHHQREEEVLFPLVEAHGITLPTHAMRGDHDQFRARKRRLYQLAQAAPEGEFAPFKAQVLEIGRLLSRELSEHIFQEDTIVYQVALEVLTGEEWQDVKRRCDAIGYCCFKPEDADAAPEAPRPRPAAEEIDLRSVPMVRRLDTILSAWKRLAAGQALRIRNDREPRPLQALFRATEGGKFDWEYETEGPQEWVALVTRVVQAR